METNNSNDRALVAKLMEVTGLSPSAIAKRAGISPSTLTRIHHGKANWRLNPATIDALSAAFPQVFEREADERLGAYVEVEVLPSFAGMGGGGYGEGDPGRALISRQLVIEQLRAKAEDLILIDVRGDSMSPDFLHGDQILVDRRDCNPSQPGPFALWDGETYVVKLVERVPLRRGWFRIFSTNERYASYEVEEGEARILGRPVWFGRTL